jgi:fructose-1,6-bisphosphatase
VSLEQPQQRKAETADAVLGRNVLAQVSEENEEPILFQDGGDYSVVFDPLDGSSNIECGVSIGTIYGIYKKAKEEAPSVANVLRVRGSFASGC